MPTSRQPTAAALARLELLKRAFNAVMAAQWLCLDAEKLGGSFVPLLFRARRGGQRASACLAARPRASRPPTLVGLFRCPSARVAACFSDTASSGIPVYIFIYGNINIYI